MEEAAEAALRVPNVINVQMCTTEVTSKIRSTNDPGTNAGHRCRKHLIESGHQEVITVLFYLDPKRPKRSLTGRRKDG